MAIFTLAEINEQISAYKQSLIALATAQEYQYTTSSGNNRTLRRADLPEIRATLRWLGREKAALSGTGGPQILTGRPQR